MLLVVLALLAVGILAAVFYVDRLSGPLSKLDVAFYVAMAISLGLFTFGPVALGYAFLLLAFAIILGQRLARWRRG